MLLLSLCYKSFICPAPQGKTRPGWPIQMGEVQGQVLVADLNADGRPELLAGVRVQHIPLHVTAGWLLLLLLLLRVPQRLCQPC